MISPEVIKDKVYSLAIDRGPLAFCAYRGSIAHGCYDDKTSDDIDLIGCQLYPLEYYTGIHPDFSYKNGTFEYQQDSYDFLLYEARKFISLLAAGNPNVISSLWTKRDFIVTNNQFTTDLLFIKNQFISRKFHHTFRGYARGQFKNIIKKTGNKGGKRKALIEKHGYDTKHAHHCIRLLRMYHEFLHTGEFKVYRDEDADDLMNIKLGLWTLDEIQQEYLFLDEAINKTYDLVYTEIPENPNWNVINAFAMTHIINHIDQQRKQMFC